SSAANLRAPTSMLLKNSLASDFMTRPTTGFFSSARAEDAQRAIPSRPTAGSAANRMRHFVFMASSLEGRRSPTPGDAASWIPGGAHLRRRLRPPLFRQSGERVNHPDAAPAADTTV